MITSGLTGYGLTASRPEFRTIDSRFVFCNNSERVDHSIDSAILRSGPHRPRFGWNPFGVKSLVTATLAQQLYSLRLIFLLGHAQSSEASLILSIHTGPVFQ